MPLILIASLHLRLSFFNCSRIGEKERGSSRSKGNPTVNEMRYLFNSFKSSTSSCQNVFFIPKRFLHTKTLSKRLKEAVLLQGSAEKPLSDSIITVIKDIQCVPYDEWSILSICMVLQSLTKIRPPKENNLFHYFLPNISKNIYSLNEQDACMLAESYSHYLPHSSSPQLISSFLHQLLDQFLYKKSSKHSKHPKSPSSSSVLSPLALSVLLKAQARLYEASKTIPSSIQVIYPTSELQLDYLLSLCYETFPLMTSQQISVSLRSFYLLKFPSHLIASLSPLIINKLTKDSSLSFLALLNASKLISAYQLDCKALLDRLCWMIRENAEVLYAENETKKGRTRKNGVVEQHVGLLLNIFAKANYCDTDIINILIDTLLKQTGDTSRFIDISGNAISLLRLDIRGALTQKLLRRYCDVFLREPSLDDTELTPKEHILSQTQFFYAVSNITHHWGGSALRDTEMAVQIMHRYYYKFHHQLLDFILTHTNDHDDSLVLMYYCTLLAFNQYSPSTICSLSLDQLRVLHYILHSFVDRRHFSHRTQSYESSFVHREVVATLHSLCNARVIINEPYVPPFTLDAVLLP